MARIKVDLDRKLGAVDRKIYGQFIEHLGRCIYGGIYDEGSALSDESGFRKDVLEAVKKLRSPILRWPGGNFVSGYHWEDGIGPKGSRPARFDRAWYAVESNRFGTDEFMKYCAKAGAEPYICVNLGSGTFEEAANWVEYCNSSLKTHYADSRRKNGHESPYNVTYWGLGNEMNGDWQIGAKNATDYATAAIEFVKVMRWTDPRIKLVAVGHDTPWNLEVLRRLWNHIDYLSLHIYVGSDDYYHSVASSVALEKRIERFEHAIELIKAEKRSEKSIHIAVDEWNVWHRVKWSPLEEKYNLCDALTVAGMLNAMQRHCRTITMANFAQMVNVIAPIITNETGLFLQTTYFPLYLYANYCGDVALDALIECDTYDTVHEVKGKLRTSPGFKSVPYLDCSATWERTSRILTLAVVNRHRDEHCEARIELLGMTPQGSYRLHRVTGADVNVENSFEEPENVKIESESFSDAGQSFTHVFAPHSLTMLQIQC